MYVVCTIAHTFVHTHLLLFYFNIFVKKYAEPYTCLQSRISELPYPTCNVNFLLQVQSWNRVHLRTSCGDKRNRMICNVVGRGGALVEAMPFVRRVMGSTPALAVTFEPWSSS